MAIKCTGFSTSLHRNSWPEYLLLENIVSFGTRKNMKEIGIGGRGIEGHKSVLNIVIAKCFEMCIESLHLHKVKFCISGRV